MKQTQKLSLGRKINHKTNDVMPFTGIRINEDNSVEKTSLVVQLR